MCTSEETTVIHNEAQSEGEKNKVIQASQNNSVPFPSTKDNQVNYDPQDEDQSPEDQYRCRKRNRPLPGAFKAMNEGLTAAITVTTDDNDNNTQEQLEHIDRYLNCFSEYLPNVALVGQNTADPRNPNEALHGPNAKEWQDVLQYKINQLEKLGTWKVKDLPPRNDTNTV